jgi:hypothetical protein
VSLRLHRVRLYEDSLTRFVFSLCLLILVAAIVHQFADWWNGVGLYLDQVKIPVTGNFKRTLGGYDSDHLAIFVN